MDIQTEVRPLGQPGGGKNRLVGFIVCTTSAFVAVLTLAMALLQR